MSPFSSAIREQCFTDTAAGGLSVDPDDDRPLQDRRCVPGGFDDPGRAVVRGKVARARDNFGHYPEIGRKDLVFALRTIRCREVEQSDDVPLVDLRITFADEVAVQLFHRDPEVDNDDHGCVDVREDASGDQELREFVAELRELVLALLRVFPAVLREYLRSLPKETFISTR